MIRGLVREDKSERRWPRTSGDDPAVELLPDAIYALAPHERG